MTFWGKLRYLCISFICTTGRVFGDMLCMISTSQDHPSAGEVVTNAEAVLWNRPETSVLQSSLETADLDTVLWTLLEV
jgi:hypothetical protein